MQIRLPAVVFILLLLVSGAAAQVFKGGILGGVAASQVDGDSYSGYRKAGVYAGGWINLSLSERAGMQFELSYLQKGSRHNPDSLDYSFYLMRLGYVEAPLFFTYSLKNSIYLLGGPSFSFILHSHESRDYLTIERDNFRVLNVSTLLGVGLPLSGRVNVEFRNCYSLFSIRKHPSTGDIYRFFGYGQFNNVITLLLTYQL